MAGTTIESVAAELERVKQVLGAQLGVSLQSPEQAEQAEKDAAAAERQAAKDAKA